MSDNQYGFNWNARLSSSIMVLGIALLGTFVAKFVLCREWSPLPRSPWWRMFAATRTVNLDCSGVSAWSAEEMWVRTVFRPCSSVFYLCVLCRCMCCLPEELGHVCECVFVSGAKRKAPYLSFFFFLMVWLKSFTSCASWGAITRLRFFFFLLHTRRFCAHMKRGARAHGSWARSSIVAKARSTSPTHILTEHRHFARDERYHHILVVPSCATFLSSFFFFFIVLHGRIWWINAIGNCRRA